MIATLSSHDLHGNDATPIPREQGLAKTPGVNHSRAMANHDISIPKDVSPWGKVAMAREINRLTRVLPRLPESWREEILFLVTTAQKVIEQMDDESVHVSERYALSCRLEDAWLKVSGVGHAASNWMVDGHLFVLEEWKAHRPLGAVDVPWLEQLAIEREVLGASIEERHNWFYERAMEQRGERAAPMVREYDPTEVPSYEFVWDE